LKINQKQRSMAGIPTPMSKIKQILLLKKQGISNREVARMEGIDKETVNIYVKFINDNHLIIDELLKKDEPELDHIFHAGNPAYTDERMKDFLEELPYYREQLQQRHVTRYLLWTEYKTRHHNGYGKSQFFFHLKQNLVAVKDKSNAVMAKTYVPGQKLYVDFAGDKLSYIDLDTGEEVKVEVFVACMPYSDYAFVVCVPSQKKEDFIDAIRQCLEYLGGVPSIIVPDNLKSAVNKTHRYEPEINEALRDMGNHYHFVAMPCQPYEPTQKALVENHVKLAYHHIYAKLRNRTFYSLRELNEAIRKLLDEHNQTRMQKRPYSREENFHANEKPLLQKLPATEYEITETTSLTVQANCCVELRRNGITHFYSVPYIHVGRKTQVVFTKSIVKIYCMGELVATHTREHKYGYSIKNEHFASNNRIVMEKCSSNYIERASRISEPFGRYVERLFDKSRSSEPEEVYYKTCDMIFSLHRRYDENVFNQTCELCLKHDVFTGKRFEAILKNKYLLRQDGVAVEAPTPTGHANMRGANYYV